MQADGLVVTVSQYLSDFYGYKYHLLGTLCGPVCLVPIICTFLQC